MDIWLSFFVIFYVVNSNLAVSRPEEKKLISNMFSNAQNDVINLIWDQKPVSFCRILKPSEDSLHDQVFLTYNFNQLLCVILSDASLRYLNFSPPPRDETELFINISKQNPAPEEFCDQMKKTNWTTNIEGNVIWLQEFNSMMNNESLCRRYCVAAEVINPLCSYSMWLHKLVKEVEYRQVLQQKIEASRMPPIPILRSRVTNQPPLRHEPNVPRPPPPPLARNSGSTSIIAVSPSDSHVLVDHDSLARYPDSAVGLGLVSGNGVETDLTNRLTSKDHGHLKEGEMATIPKTFDVKGGNSHTPSEQNSQLNYPTDVDIDSKSKTWPKPSKPTDLTVGAKPLVSVPSPMKSTKGSSDNPKISTDEVVTGRRQDSNTQSNGATSVKVPHVEQDKGKQNEPASITHAISSTNRNDKEKLTSAAIQLPKQGTDMKTAVSVGKEKTEDITLGNKEHAAGTDPKTLVEPEGKEAANEGMPDSSLQVEPNNHEQKDREDTLEGEDPEVLERQEEQSPEGDLATAEPRFGGEIEDPANGRSTSPKNFEYDSEDEPILPINGVEQEKVTQNDAGAGMYVHDRFVDAEDSHFFAYFMTMIILCILGYLIFHNKQKILALALEGRARKGNRRRPSTSGYRKLDSNLEEAVTSNCAGASVTHVIY